MEPGGTSLERRELLRKMMVAGAGAAIAPTVLTRPAGAQAVPSGCEPVLLDWDLVQTGPFTGTSVGGVTVTSTAVADANATLFATNNSVQTGPLGGTAGRHLFLEMLPANSSASGTSAGQTFTISFSTTVSDVTFTLLDIDTLNNGWGDRIRPLGTYSATIPGGSSVQQFTSASGTAFRNSNSNFNFPDTSGGGNLTLTYPGPLTQMVFRYYNFGETGGANQKIGISDISFVPCPPAGARALEPSTRSRGAAESVPPDDPSAPVGVGDGSQRD